jgi:hypothetical protein
VLLGTCDSGFLSSPSAPKPAVSRLWLPSDEMALATQELSVFAARMQAVDEERAALDQSLQTGREYTLLDQAAGMTSVLANLLADVGSRTERGESVDPHVLFAALWGVDTAMGVIYDAMCGILDSAQQNRDQTVAALEEALADKLEAAHQSIERARARIREATSQARREFRGSSPHVLTVSHRLHVTRRGSGLFLDVNAGGSVDVEVSAPGNERLLRLTASDLLTGTEIERTDFRASGTLSISVPEGSAVALTVHQVDAVELARSECVVEIRYPRIAPDPQPFPEDKRSQNAALSARLLGELNQFEEEIRTLAFPPTHQLPEDDLAFLADAYALTFSSLATNVVAEDFKSVDKLHEDAMQKADAINELSEMTLLRLQMTMERRAQYVSTLSTILKKISDTQEDLVDNLK